MSEKLKQNMTSVERALERLKIAIDQNYTDELVVDGTIQHSFLPSSNERTV